MYGGGGGWGWETPLLFRGERSLTCSVKRAMVSTFCTNPLGGGVGVGGGGYFGVGSNGLLRQY